MKIVVFVILALVVLIFAFAHAVTILEKVFLPIALEIAKLFRKKPPN